MFRRFITVIMIISIMCSAISTGIIAAAKYEEEIVYGDVDGNGVVNTEDARLALQIASGVVVVEDEVQLKRSDINSDGAVTIFDARQILRGIAGLAYLQPTGAISGFDGGGVFGNEETLVAYFNAYLNKIKVTQGDGKQYIAPQITKTESDVLNALSVEKIEFPAFSFGTSADSIVEIIEEALTEDDKENEVTQISRGSDDLTLVSVEGASYVSNLSASDVFGSRARYDKEYELLTIEIALPDTEVDLVEQSAYAKVLNATNLLEKQDTTLMSIIKAGLEETSMFRELKDCVLKIVVDLNTANVLSYTITYQSKVYVAQADFNIGSLKAASLKGIEFKKDHSVKYENFEWTEE